MEDALTAFGVAAMIAATGFVIHTFANWWVRARQLERAEREPLSGAPPGVEARLARIEQAVDAIAVEVERISEAQRFTTNLLADRRPPEHALPGGARETPKRD